MPPKGKKAATAKPPKAEKEGKAEKKGKAKKGSGEGNDTAPKVASRASKRNADKVAVSYKEVAENVDEKASEGSRPRPKPTKAKKAKVDSGSEVSESDEEADSEAEKPKKKRSPAKKRPVKEKVTAPLAAKEPAAEKAEDNGEASDDEPLPTKKAKVEESESEPKEKLKGKTDTDFEAIDFKNEKTTADGKLWNKKISSWNICGLKAWVKKGALEYLKHENPDMFCMQETRCHESKLPPGTKVEGYHAYWHCGTSGHDGVAIYTKDMPIEVKYGMDKAEHDADHRIITAEFEKFYLVNAYVPNAGRGLVTLPKRLKWDPDFRTYLKELDNKKPVILCGDLNVAHQAIDLTNPKTNAKTAGFTQEERDGMSELLKEGFVDTYRTLYPDKTGEYTFWTYMNNARAKNIGWRVDYFIVSEKLKDNMCDSVMRSQVYGSDHCPIALMVNV